MIDITKHNIINNKLSSQKILILSDMHSEVFYDIDTIIYEEKPDFIVMCGDIIDNKPEKDDWGEILHWLKYTNRKKPIFFSMGNHEMYAGLDVVIPKLKETGITVLDNEFVQFNDVTIYGFTPTSKKDKICPTNLPKNKDTTIVLCHEPNDFYETELIDKNFFLTISGHCHGGQWRLFNRGMYAPNQGWFPKYTSGFYFDNKLLISRGLGNKANVPRINNNPEVIILKIN